MEALSSPESLRNKVQRFGTWLNGWESYAPNLFLATHTLKLLSCLPVVEVTIVITCTVMLTLSQACVDHFTCIISFSSCKHQWDVHL